MKLAREAWTSLGSHPLRTFFMALGVAVGVAALAAVVSIGQGARARISGIVAKHGLDMLMVRPGGERQVLASGVDRNLSSLSEADAAAIESSLRNIEMVGLVQNQRGWEVAHGENAFKTRVFGVSPKWELIRRRGILRGRGIEDGDVATSAKVMVLGYTVWKDLFGEADPVGQSLRLGNDPYQVVGVYVEMGVSAGGDQWDDRVVLPWTTTAKKLFGRSYLEQIVVRVRDVGRIQETKREIEALLRERRSLAPGAPADFFVREPGDVEAVAMTATSAVEKALVAVAGVALLGGGLVIMNIMLLSVSQRTREIGLRRALGARRGEITRQFLLEALLVALAGGAAGTAAGLGAAPLLSPDHALSWVPFAAALGACVGVALLSGIYPAVKAARVDPVESLRR
jgi:putative ABC transport system permease protein